MNPDANPPYLGRRPRTNQLAWHLCLVVLALTYPIAATAEPSNQRDATQTTISSPDAGPPQSCNERHSPAYGAISSCPIGAGMPENLRKRLETLSEQQSQNTISNEDKPRLRRLRHIQKLFEVRQERKARLKVLDQKAKDGTLSNDEKTELERTRQRDSRFAELGKQDLKQNATRKQRNRQSKRQLLQEFPSLAENAGATAEYQKHAERVAQLERAKDVAVALQDSAAALVKIEQLLLRERKRHQSWLAKQPSAATRLVGR